MNSRKTTHKWLKSHSLRLVLIVVGLGIGFIVGAFIVFQAFFLSSVLPHGGF